MAWITTGTVAVTNGSATVTGTGTAWTTDLQVGWAFIGPDGVPYEITAIVSATQITIAPAYGGTTASGASYRVQPTLSLRNDLAAQFLALRDLWSNVSTFGQSLVDDADAPAARTTLGLGGAATQEYSSGTFPAVIHDMSGNSVPLSPKVIPYVRVGGLVTIFWNFMNNIDTTGLVGTDDIRFSLPFTNANHSFEEMVIAALASGTGPYFWYSKLGEAYSYIRDAGTGSNLKVSAINSGVTDIIGGTITISV